MKVLNTFLYGTSVVVMLPLYIFVGWFACGRGDLYNTGFVATTPGGDRITGTVCSGILTGSRGAA
jgi:hypothetical protein